MLEEKYRHLTPETIDKIDKAIHSILSGNCSRVDVSDQIKVYMCKNVIRVDLKIRESI